MSPPPGLGLDDLVRSTQESHAALDELFVFASDMQEGCGLDDLDDAAAGLSLTALAETLEFQY